MQQPNSSGPTPNPRRIDRKIRLKWIAVNEIHVSPVAQRRLRPHFVAHLVANPDLDKLGTPVVSLRDGRYYVVDGQHRIEMLKAIGFGDLEVECEIREGLTETSEAQLFDKLNDRLKVDKFDGFKVRIQGGYPLETDIDRIVRLLGLCISKDKVPGAIGAVAALEAVYKRGGPHVLSRTLRIVRDAYGDAGLQALVIDGIGLLCQRYNGELGDDEAIEKLRVVLGGVNGLKGAAQKLHLQTGEKGNICVAAAAIDIVNRGRGRKKLPDWWKQ